MSYSFSNDIYGVHRRIIELVPFGSNVLEVGCASGYISKRLKAKKCNITGVELNKSLVKKAKKYLKKVIIADIENKKTWAKIPKEKFDVILYMDILEHLKNPLNVLKKCCYFLKRDVIIVISVPNVAFLTERLMHLMGRFDYTDSGILDRTHLTFFTKKTVLELIESSGLKVSKFDYVGNFTQLPLFMQTLYPLIGKKNWWRKIEYKVTGYWQEGLAVQFLIVCKIR